MVSAYASHFQLFPSFFSRISFHFSAAPLTLSLSLLFMYVVIKLYFQLNQMECDRKDTIIEISMSASHTESESERERQREMQHNQCNWPKWKMGILLCKHILTHKLKVMRTYIILNSVFLFHLLFNLSCGAKSFPCMYTHIHMEHTAHLMAIVISLEIISSLLM